MKKLLFSVVIPVHNEENYILNTLKRVSTQSIKRSDYEIIIGDAYSSDKTVVLSKKYADKIIKNHTTNPAQGRNCGAKKAKGEIIVFIDADTWIRKDALQKIKETISKGYIGGTFEVAGINATLADKIAIKLIMFLERLFYFLGFITVNGQCLFIKKSIFNKISGFNNDLDINEDHDFMRRAKKYGKIALLHDKVMVSLRRIRKIGWIKQYWIWLIALIQGLFSKKVKSNYWIEDLR